MNLTIHDAEYLALYLEISELFTGGVIRVATSYGEDEDEEDEEVDEEEEEEEEQAPDQTHVKTFVDRLTQRSRFNYKEELTVLANLVPEGEITANSLLKVLNEKYTPLVSPATLKKEIMSSDMADWEYEKGWMRSFC